jgi:Resolvase, N terminal domain
LQHCRHWKYAFASQHKDHRYYEIVADTLHSEFRYLYFALRDAQGQIQAIQPFFILDQDILAGARPYIGNVLDLVRRQWPRFLLMRTMMVGCVAGEGHLDDGNWDTRAVYAQLLAGAIAQHARNEMHALGIELFLYQQALDTTTPAGKAMFQMLGVFSEFERAMIVERVRSGLAKAKAKGTRSGRRRECPPRGPCRAC